MWSTIGNKENAKDIISAGILNFREKTPMNKKYKAPIIDIIYNFSFVVFWVSDLVLVLVSQFGLPCFFLFSVKSYYN